MWRGLVRLCLVLLVTGGGCDTQAPSVTGRSPTTGADASPYRRGVWLLLDQGENRHACDSHVAGRYRYIVVQWSATRNAACPLERIRAANPDVKVLAYQNVGAMIAGPHTNGRPSTCVTQEEAAAHDAAAALGDAWQLHDKTGNVLAFQDQYAYLDPGNVGRTSYQAQCLRRLARIEADGYDGVLADDVNVSPGHGLGEHGTPIAEYPTDALYGDAMVKAMRRIGPGAARLGLMMVPNVGADPGARPQRAKALEIVRVSSGFFTEFWTRWEGAGASQSGPAWEAGVTFAQEVETLGKPFLASTYHGPGLHGAAADQQYAVASFWVVWGGRQDSGWGYDVPGDPAAGFSPAWGPDMGAPLDPVRVRVGVGWRRRYVGGFAVVNPSQATPQRFELGADYRKPDGSVTATVILPPMSGMVLTRTATTPRGRA